MRLWDATGSSVDAAVLVFSVGDDPVLDAELLPYDCLASAAHATMLESIGLLSTDELSRVLDGLREALHAANHGELTVSIEQEDGHTALEQFLTERIGEAGKKIHTGRSRNDQVIMALRLLVRERLVHIADVVHDLVEKLLTLSQQHRKVVMPGYTHTRQAMPTTAGHSFAAVAEGLISDLGALQVPLQIANRCALGSASGYGVPLPLDRERVAQLLGLSGVDINTLHVQNTRGRLEATVLHSLHLISLTLGRFATDLIWFSSEAFGFVRLPEILTTGSSIMPQKRNPDILELIRAMPASMMGRYVEVAGSLHGLPAGYHRDLQRTKSPLLRSLSEMLSGVSIMQLAAERLEVDAAACEAGLLDAIYATDHVYALVRNGTPFRDAYRTVKEGAASPLDSAAVLSVRSHTGAPGTDQADALRAALDKTAAEIRVFADGAATSRQLLE